MASVWTTSRRDLWPVVTLVVASLFGVVAVSALGGPGSGAAGAATGTVPIQHVVMIMQENRSFDHYFGTYPGANGIPMNNGVPTVCIPDPLAGQCQSPYHDTADINHGGPHSSAAFVSDYNGGNMDGFIATTEQANGGKEPDVMGYHTRAEIPSYWAYADNFVLQDAMFESVPSYSGPSHLNLVSGWVARCTVWHVPSSCAGTLKSQEITRAKGTPQPEPNYAWTDITYLLYKNNVSWGYYVSDGNVADCPNGEFSCQPQPQKIGTPEIWNPLPEFQTVQEDGQSGNDQPVANFLSQASAGTLPAVSWIVPDEAHSEHPATKISSGQSYVTNLVNTIMQGPDWASTAIFVSWDEWGGFYDHVAPPAGSGYGFRVPALVISPYAKIGFIDHQVLSFDAYLKFVEDVFLGGQRIDPATDGRPDPRAQVAENSPFLGDLMNDFNFAQTPRRPLILPTNGP